MRFCADSIRSCFFIEKFGSYRLSLLTGKGYGALTERCGSSPSSMGTHISFQCTWIMLQPRSIGHIERSSKVECMRTTNLAQTTASLPSPLMGFHLQVDFLNKIHLLFSDHKPSSLQLCALVSVALE